MTSRFGYTLEFSVGSLAGRLTTATTRDGDLSDVFLRVGEHGSTLAGLTEALATGISTALRRGVPLSALTAELHQSHAGLLAPTDDPEIPRSTSIPDYVARRLSADFPRRPNQPT